jgi:hypothetical protein
MKYRKLNIGNEYTVVEQIERIGEEDFHLIPNHHKFISDLYGETHNYNMLDKLSTTDFVATNQKPCSWDKAHFDFLPDLMPLDLCEHLINTDQTDPEAIKNPEVIKRLLALLEDKGLGEKNKAVFWQQLYVALVFPLKNNRFNREKSIFIILALR